MTEQTKTNRLAFETSPYLLQHKFNPVDWYPWGTEPLLRAKSEDRPILLSVGYSACHWCHVMERESFENSAIAELMNTNFVCIKVDREERPDIDQIYMGAVQALAGQGGWPMTVFLTPDCKPFYGGTYYPPADTGGRPGFPRVLQAVADAWAERRDEVRSQADRLTAAIRRDVSEHTQPGVLTREVVHTAATRLVAGADQRYGGFGGAPKFPQPLLLEFLLACSKLYREPIGSDPTVHTLDRMCMGGLYDQIGGGFHRYSTDEVWLVPHFEKMLYDNAQLARTYLHAWQVTGDERYSDICTGTLEYVLREMTHAEGGFFSAQDADSEGEEGRFFVWTPSQITQALGEQDAELFCRLFNITARGNFEGSSIPNLTVDLGQFAAAQGVTDSSSLANSVREMKAKLLAARAARVWPHLDDKIVTAWNGLMLGAFAAAGAVLRRPDYIAAAVKCAEFIERRLVRDGRLMRTGRFTDSTTFATAPVIGFLEDYADYVGSLLSLHQATQDTRWLIRSVELLDQVTAHFSDGKYGFFDTADDAEALIERPRDTTDGATPSGGAALAWCMIQVGRLVSRTDLIEAGRKATARMVEPMAQYPQAFGKWLNCAALCVGPRREVVVVGSRDDPDTAALLAAAASGYHPWTLTLWGEPNGSAEGFPLLEGRVDLHKGSAAYVCTDGVCSLPVTDAAALATLLEHDRDARA